MTCSFSTLSCIVDVLVSAVTSGEAGEAPPHLLSLKEKNEKINKKVVFK